MAFSPGHERAPLRSRAVHELRARRLLTKTTMLGAPPVTLHPRPVPLFIRENALTLAIGGLFVASFVGQILAGHAAFNEEARDHGAAASSLGTYLTSGHFIEAIFENWESEFLQMGVFVVLTKFLKQKGSSESKKLDEHEAVDDDPRDAPLRSDRP